MSNVSKIATGIVGAIISIIVVFLIIGGMSSTITDSASNISGSGLPLASLFGSSGVVLIVFMVAVLLGIIALAFKMFKG